MRELGKYMAGENTVDGKLFKISYYFFKYINYYYYFLV